MKNFLIQMFRLALTAYPFTGMYDVVRGWPGKPAF